MPWKTANGPRDEATPAEAGAAVFATTVSELLNNGSHGRIPALGDGVLGGRLLVERREHGLGVERWGGELGKLFGRNGVLAGEVVEADRVAVTGEPAELTFVRIEILHPELGGVRVRCIGRDRLDVHTGDDSIRRDHDLSLRIAGKAVLPGEGVVVPGGDDRGGALGDRGGLADYRHEVAGLVQVGEERQALGAGIGTGAATVGEAGGVHRLDRLVGRTRVTGQSALVGEIRLL